MALETWLPRRRTVWCRETERTQTPEWFEPRLQIQSSVNSLHLPTFLNTSPFSSFFVALITLQGHPIHVFVYLFIVCLPTKPKFYHTHLSLSFCHRIPNYQTTRHTLNISWLKKRGTQYIPLVLDLLSLVFVMCFLDLSSRCVCALSLEDRVCLIHLCCLPA